MTTEQKSNSFCTTTVPPISWNDKVIIDPLDLFIESKSKDEKLYHQFDTNLPIKKVMN
jgi:hypothetical protein|tara:strand:+ start:167 stop:340 length:174 start_codon:yes stop_codon:yes gene_type:complete